MCGDSDSSLVVLWWSDWLGVGLDVNLVNPDVSRGRFLIKCEQT